MEINQAKLSFKSPFSRLHFPPFVSNQVSTLDGVLEVRNEHFWTVGFGSLVRLSVKDELFVDVGGSESERRFGFCTITRRRNATMSLQLTERKILIGC